MGVRNLPGCLQLVSAHARHIHSAHKVAVAVMSQMDTLGREAVKDLVAKEFAEKLHAKWGVGRAECQVVAMQHEHDWKWWSEGLEMRNTSCAEVEVGVGEE
eukprot:scaffold234996_cov22-Tisochrysis_lutea.AAC.1